MSVRKRTLFDFCADRDPFSLEWIAGWTEGRCCGFPGRPNQIFEYRITFPVSALLIVEHYIEKRTADLQPAVVVDKKKFSELIHEKVDAAASSRHQFRQQAGYGHVTRRR